MKPEMFYKNFYMKLEEVIRDTGEFSGWLTVYGEIDTYGDMMAPGSFSDTIAENNGEFPYLWQHQLNEPIGMVRLSEESKGIRVNGKLNLTKVNDIACVPRAYQAYGLIRQSGITGLSYGFFRKDFRVVDESIVEILKAEVIEVSYVTRPALASARIDSIKSDQDNKIIELERKIFILESKLDKITKKEDKQDGLSFFDTFGGNGETCSFIELINKEKNN